MTSTPELTHLDDLWEQVTLSEEIDLELTREYFGKVEIEFAE